MATFTTLEDRYGPMDAQAKQILEWVTKSPILTDSEKEQVIKDFLLSSDSKECWLSINGYIYYLYLSIFGQTVIEYDDDNGFRVL